MKYYLIGYAELQQGSLSWTHCNEVIDYEPSKFIIECKELKDRQVALTMIHEIDIVEYNKLKDILG